MSENFSKFLKKIGQKFTDNFFLSYEETFEVILNKRSVRWQMSYSNVFKTFNFWTHLNFLISDLFNNWSFNGGHFSERFESKLKKMFIYHLRIVINKQKGNDKTRIIYKKRGQGWNFGRIIETWNYLSRKKKLRQKVSKFKTLTREARRK